MKGERFGVKGERFGGIGEKSGTKGERFGAVLVGYPQLEKCAAKKVSFNR
jgi:hypothetical protein